MGRHLTAQGFTHAPELLGDVVRIAPDGTPFTLAVVFGFVRNEGNAWSWILDHLTRTIDAHTPAVPSEASESDLLSDCEAVVAAIGRRLGEMHAILMQESSDPAFAPKVADGDDAETWARKTEERIRLAFEGIARLQTWEREKVSSTAFSMPSARSRVSAWA
jgi:maltose alpha-D-glucosyltransferase/alpha-amylase